MVLKDFACKCGYEIEELVKSETRSIKAMCPNCGKRKIMKAKLSAPFCKTSKIVPGTGHFEYQGCKATIDGKPCIKKNGERVDAKFNNEDRRNALRDEKHFEAKRKYGKNKIWGI